MKSDKIIVANWKSLITSTADAKKVITAYKKFPPQKRSRVITCPPAPLLPLVLDAKLITGSQSVSDEHAGSTTGKIPAELLANIKVKYAIVGHSEERANGVQSKTVREQILRLLESGITPIVCVGEQSRPDSNPLGELQDMVAATFRDLNKSQIEKCILAYEPVWAIGAAAIRPATPHEAQEAILFCKKILMTKVLEGKKISMTCLYGGSVDPTNAAEFLGTHDVDGLLIGRVSTDATKFAKIVALI